MPIASARASIHRFYAAVPTSISVAREELAEFAEAAGVGGDELERMRLATSEALTNVVEHAYGEGEGEIEVLGAVSADELSVLVADRGPGLRGGGTSEGLGLGLALMRMCSDALTFQQRSGGGLEVQMRFALGRAPGATRARQGRGSASSASRPASPVFSTTT